MMFASLLLLVSKVAVIDAADSYGHSWNYQVNGVLGPSRWSVNASICGRSFQSPINILTKHVKYNKDLNIKLKDYDQKGGNVTFIMVNRNTDIAFEGKAKNGATIPQTVIFKGDKYRFFQFHFHWGAENHKGSEHLVDWQRSSGELHIIHQNTKYGNIKAAMVQQDGLLVWGHFLRVNSVNDVENPDFQKLLDNFGKATECCTETDVDVNLFKLLPKSHEEFFTYQGGLTTPPCYESVRWIVNRSPIYISEAQMNTFRSLKDKEMGGTILADNFRPPQPLNGRIVESNFDPAEPYAGAGVTVSPCFLTVFSIFAACLLML